MNNANPNEQVPQVDSKRFRDAALQRVMDNAGRPFKERARDCIAQTWAGKKGTAEDFRITCVANGIKPHHHNAWGGLTMGLIHSGLIKDTGELAQMKARKSHRRKTPIYQVLADPLFPKEG